MHIDKTKHISVILLHFLETGALPWYSNVNSISDLHEGMDGLLKSGEQEFTGRLKILLSINKNSLNRFIEQFGERQIESFLQTFPLYNRLREDVPILQQLLKDNGISGNRIKKIIYRSALSFLLKSDNNMILTSNFFEMAVDEMTGLEKEFIHEAITKTIPERKHKGGGIPHQVLYQIQALIDTNNSTSNGDGNTLKSESNTKNHEKQESQNIGTSAEYENEFFIANSGLVLLHPFLPGLFTNCGYLEKNEWLNEDVKQRAVALTHYLSTGQEEYAEFEMLLNKLLCGSRFEISLPYDLQLSDYEKNEANDVLQSAIKHWAALKNTSIEGLRNTFLLRNGKLAKGDGGWLLQTEQQTADILLNKLPWGFSMIRLPWMEQMLRVDWNY